MEFQIDFKPLNIFSNANLYYTYLYKITFLTSHTLEASKTLLIYFRLTRMCAFYYTSQYFTTYSTFGNTYELWMPEILFMSQVIINIERDSTMVAICTTIASQY